MVFKKGVEVVGIPPRQVRREAGVVNVGLEWDVSGGVGVGVGGGGGWSWRWIGGWDAVRVVVPEGAGLGHVAEAGRAGINGLVAVAAFGRAEGWRY